MNEETFLNSSERLIVDDEDDEEEKFVSFTCFDMMDLQASMTSITFSEDGTRERKT